MSDTAMQATFDVRAERSSGIVHIVLTGFFFERDVVLFGENLRSVLHNENYGFGRHLALCDIVGMRIQSRSIVQSFSALMRTPSLRSKKLAFVTASSLARKQACRLTDRDGVRFFRNEPEAHAWLTDLESARARASVPS